MQNIYLPGRNRKNYHKLQISYFVNIPLVITKIMRECLFSIFPPLPFKPVQQPLAAAVVDFSALVPSEIGWVPVVAVVILGIGVDDRCPPHVMCDHDISYGFFIIS